jgi:hypothetical protein
VVPRLTTFFSGVLLTAGQLSCGGEATPNPIEAAFAQQVPTGPSGITVAFRFPRQPDLPIQLYSLPTMDPVAIEFEVPNVATEEFVGFVREEDLVYVRNVDGQLRALDLTAGRFRIVDSLVQKAVIGPTGTPFIIREDLTIRTVRNRTLRTWPGPLRAAPRQAWGALGSGILVHYDDSDGPRLAAVTTEWDGSTIAVPRGLTVSSIWGDLVVVATDSGLVGINPLESTGHHFLELAAPVTAVAISPSGHRVYAASSTGQLHVVNRFEFSILETVTLPGQVSAIRTDPLGRYLLMRPADGQLIWISPVSEPGDVIPTDGEWTEQLPQVAPDGSVLVRYNGQVRAVSAATGATTGSLRDGASDVWAILTWDPRRPTLQVAAQRSTRSASPEPGVIYYAQVSSTSNLDWAQDEITRLNQAGLPAELIPQTEFDDRYRVGLGPFRTREEAEETGRILGRAFFVVTIGARENQ